jgi:hypothetical protein
MSHLRTPAAVPSGPTRATELVSCFDRNNTPVYVRSAQFMCGQLHSTADNLLCSCCSASYDFRRPQHTSQTPTIAIEIVLQTDCISAAAAVSVTAAAAAAVR